MLSLHAQGCDLVMTTSRRTSPEAAAYFKKQLAPSCLHSYFHGEGGENPYVGYLASADVIVSPSDSKTMLSEAAATNAPVITMPSPHLTAGAKKFVENLLTTKRVVDWHDFSSFDTQVPMNVAEIIRQRVLEVVGDKVKSQQMWPSPFTASPR
jgi:mitochondrial fission protein ELM1